MHRPRVLVTHSTAVDGVDASVCRVTIVYCIIITISTIAISQRLRHMCNLISGIDQYYVSELLPEDKSLIKLQKSRSDLFVAMVSIGS